MSVSVRYIVNDVEAAVRFYTSLLGFEVRMNPGPGFAMLDRGDLRLLLNQPGAGGAGQQSSAGQSPEPGGWNRFQIAVEDLNAIVANLKAQGATVRTDVVTGNAGKQAVVEDPSGNPVELFQSF